MENIRVEGTIVFLYYHDIEKASDFYRHIMRFEPVVTKNWVKIFKISGNSHIGLVDKEHGWHKPSIDKPVMLSLMVPDVEAWFNYLKGKGIKTDLDSPKVGKEIKMKAFRIWDTEDHVIEILEFFTPYGL